MENTESQNPLQGLYNAEINICATAFFGMDKVRTGELGTVQFVDRLYKSVLSWSETKQAVIERTSIPNDEITMPLVIQYVYPTLRQAYESEVMPIVEQGYGLEGNYPDANERLNQVLFHGEINITEFFGRLEANIDNRDIVPEHIGNWYQSPAKTFHKENGGNCQTSGATCPGMAEGTCPTAAMVGR